MKMIYRVGRRVFFTVFLAMAPLLGCGIPFENTNHPTSADQANISVLAGAILPSFEAIPQGSAQCGPTSLYMIFNYYADQRIFEQQDCHELVDLSKKPTIITKDTDFCQYVNSGSNYGTSWSMMRDAMANLRLNCKPYYIVELEDRFTKYNNSSAEAERFRRFGNLVENYLGNGWPVIIHLKRYWWLTGHYIVLIGYDPVREIVTYADPNGATLGTVDLDDFIRTKWYVSPTNPADWYRARWDGEWMAFYHLESDTE